MKQRRRLSRSNRAQEFEAILNAHPEVLKVARLTPPGNPSRVPDNARYGASVGSASRVRGGAIVCTREGATLPPPASHVPEDGPQHHEAAKLRQR